MVFQFLDWTSPVFPGENPPYLRASFRLPKLALWKVTTEAGIVFLMETQGADGWLAIGMEPMDGVINLSIGFFVERLWLIMVVFFLSSLEWQVSWS